MTRALHLEAFHHGARGSVHVADILNQHSKAIWPTVPPKAVARKHADALVVRMLAAGLLDYTTVQGRRTTKRGKTYCTTLVMLNWKKVRKAGSIVYAYEIETKWSALKACYGAIV